MRTICPASRPFCLGTLMIPRMRLRVVWGFGEMIAIFSPTSAFSSVLLPALGRPRMQANPEWKDMRVGYSLLRAHADDQRRHLADDVDSNTQLKAFPRSVSGVNGSVEHNSQS